MNKKLSVKIAALLLMVLSSLSALAQIDVTATGGTTSASYTTLFGAFDGVNKGVHTGDITISVTGNTTEPVSAFLNASGVSSASYTSLSIMPAGGAARTISGNLNVALVALNGADNITIDGLNTGGNSLTFTNLSTGGSARAFSLNNDATGNTITNCTFLGSSTSTSNGVIYIGPTAIASGNDNNTISTCNIAPAGTNYPTVAIYISGNTSSSTLNSSGNTINNCNIYDFWNNTGSSVGINATSGSTAGTFTNNRFYQTTSKSSSAGTNFAINILAGDTYTVTGNTIGYAGPAGTGQYSITGGTKFNGIKYIGTAGVTSTISNNTIAAINMNGTALGNGANAPFIGIYITGGNVTSNNNTIGSQTASADTIIFKSTATAATDIYGLYNTASSATWTSNNNIIGGIRMHTAATTTATALYGMRNTNAALTGNNNTIGGTASNSMYNSTASTAAQVVGIYINATTAAMSLSGNTIRNLTAANGTGSSTSASVIGISTISTGSLVLSQNTVYNLSNTSTSADISLSGIFVSGTSAGTIERNTIYGINVNTSGSGRVYELNIAGGTSTIKNNMITLGQGVAGNAFIYGLVESQPTTTNNIYHNSVYIGGSSASINATYSFYSFASSVTRSYRDNIFVNARTSSGTGKNYIIQVAGTGANPSGLTINNNLYYGSSDASSVFGYYNADVLSLSAWRTAVGQDANSINADPLFIAPTATTPDLHVSSTSPAEAGGADVGVTDDFDGQTRASFSPTDIGADAFTGVINHRWDGGASTTAWSDASNWNPDGVPTATDLVRFDHVITAGAYTVNISTAAAGSSVSNHETNITLNVIATGSLTTETLANSGIIDVASNGSIVQSTAGATITGTGYTVRRDKPAGQDVTKYNFWSSPMVAGNTSMLSNAQHLYKITPGYAITSGTGSNFEPYTGAMTAGRGYAATDVANAVFTGTPGTGNLTYNLQKYSVGGNNYNTNLVGNPYPSAINAKLFTDANTSNLTSASVYLWNQTQASTAAFINTQNFIAVNTLGTSSYDNSQTLASTNIASGQAFEVFAAADNAALSFTNSMRNANNSSFYKTSTVNAERVWLSIEDGLNVSSALVALTDDATAGKDFYYDSPIGQGSTSLHISSVIDNNTFAIQGLAANTTGTTEVPLAITAARSGKITLALAKEDNVQAGRYVYLLDQDDNSYTDLRQTSKEVTVGAAGKVNGRFVLVFSTNSIATGIAESSATLSNWSLQHNTNGALVIKLNAQNDYQSYEVFDVAGKLLLQAPTNNQTEITLPSETTGLVLVRVIKTDGSSESKKSLIQN